MRRVPDAGHGDTDVPAIPRGSLRGSVAAGEGQSVRRVPHRPARSEVAHRRRGPCHCRHLLQLPPVPPRVLRRRRRAGARDAAQGGARCREQPRALRMAAVACRQSVAVGRVGGSAGQCRHRRPTGTLDPREDRRCRAGAEAAALHRQPDDALGSPTGADPSVAPRRSARPVVPRHLRQASRSAPRRGARGRSRAPRRRGLDRSPPTRLRHAAGGCGGSRRRAEGGGRQHARAGGGGATRLPDRLHRACRGDGDHPRLSAPRRG